MDTLKADVGAQSINQLATGTENWENWSTDGGWSEDDLVRDWARTLFQMENVFTWMSVKAGNFRIIELIFYLDNAFTFKNNNMSVKQPSSNKRECRYSECQSVECVCVCQYSLHLSMLHATPSKSTSILRLHSFKWLRGGPLNQGPPTHVNHFSASTSGCSSSTVLQMTSVSRNTTFALLPTLKRLFFDLAGIP